MHSSILPSLLILGSGLLPSATAKNVPSNVRNFYNRVKGESTCPHKLQGGFYSQENGPKNFSYCKDDTSGVVYIHGAGGKLANMDIDCDGPKGGLGDDGRCGDSQDTQYQTSFKDVVAGYNAGITDLNAKLHPYVVFGNDDTNPAFDPKKYGIKPLSVMAVVCGDKLVYGVWGDTNGNDGPPLVGEASISLATACYGKSITGNSGHDENDVLYIAFPGASAVPGKNGAKWNAKSYEEFEASIEGRGDQLVEQLK